MAAAAAAGPLPTGDAMPDAFFSYSRRDGEFVRRLAAALKERGKEVWVDVDGIRDTERFPEALRRAIEASDAFVFVISPDSVASEFCEQEVAHASGLNKRIVPLALRPVPDTELPEEIRFRNWIPVDGEGPLEAGLERLVVALETDLDWERQHTRLTIRALEWDQAGRDRNFLVRGSELAAAERWLAVGAGKDPGPTSLEQEYLLAARAGAVRRQRTLVGGSIAISVVAIGLLVFALLSRSQAVGARSVSSARALAAESTTELQSDPEVSILLAMAAVRASPTPQALAALRDAIDASPLQARLPPRGAQSCTESPGVAYSPSGRVLAEAACDGRVIIAEGSTGRVRARWSVGHAAGPVAFSSDGRRLAVGTRAGVAVLDTSTGKLLETLSLESNSIEFAAALHCGSGPTGMPDALAFSRDGTRLAASYDWNLDIWTLARGVYPRVVGGQNSCMKGAAFRSFGARIVVGDGRNVDVIDAITGRVRQTRTVLSVSGPSDPQRPAVSAVAVSPDGRLAAVAGILNRLNASSVVLWNARTWRRVGVLVPRADTPIDELRFSSDGKRLAIGEGNGTVGIWSVSTHRQLMSLPGHVASISSVAFRPDGRALATASTDGDGRIWRTSAHEGIAIATHAGPYLTKAIVSGHRVWAAVLLPQKSELRSWTLSGVPAAGFSTRAPPYSYRAVAFSGDGQEAAIQDYAGDFPVYDLTRDRTIVRVAGLTGGVFAFQLVSGLALDSDASRLAVASNEGTQLYDLAHGHAVGAATLPACGASTQSYVAFSADSRRVVAVNACGRGTLWDARSGKQLATFNSGASSVSAIALDPDGRLLALASPDRTVVVRNLNDNSTAYVLRGDTGPINDVAFNPAGTWIATASQDEEVRIWNAANGQLLRILPAGSDVTSVSFTADGNRIVTTDSKGTIRIEDACSLCGNAEGLLRLGASRVTRQLTPSERRTFGVS